MQGVLLFIENNLISVLSVTVLTGATVATSVIGMNRVGNLSQNKLAVPDDRTGSSSSSVASISTVAVTPTATPSAQAARVSLNHASASSSSSSFAAPTSSPPDSTAPTGSIAAQLSSESATSSQDKLPGRALGKEKKTARNEDQAEEDRIHAE